MSSHNLERVAADFLQKLIQESEDEPTRLATKLHVICEYMKLNGKENSLPYQVIFRAKESVVTQHGINIDALTSSRLRLPGEAQVGGSGLVRSKDEDASDNPSREGGILIAGKPLGTPQAASSCKDKEDGLKVASLAENEIAKYEVTISIRPPVDLSCEDSTKLFDHENPAILSMEDNKSANTEKRSDNTKQTDSTMVGGKRKIDSSTAVDEPESASCISLNSKTEKLMRRQNAEENIYIRSAESSQFSAFQCSGPGSIFTPNQQTLQLIKTYQGNQTFEFPRKTFGAFTNISHNANLIKNSICTAGKGNSWTSGGFSSYSTMKTGFSALTHCSSSSYVSHEFSSNICKESSGEASCEKVPVVQLTSLRKESGGEASCEKVPVVQLTSSSHGDGGISHSASNTSRRGEEEGPSEQLSKDKLLRKREMINCKDQEPSGKLRAEVFQKDISLGGKSDVEMGSNKMALSCRPFEAPQLKQLRAQCLVFLAFRNGLVPRKLHLEIALGDGNLKEGPPRSQELGDHSQGATLKEPSNNQEGIDEFGRQKEKTRETEKTIFT